MSCALSVNQLTCQYDDQTVLENLSLSVDHGEIVCLLGASGCGKTTLLKAIAGLIPLSAGQMSLNCMTIDDGENWVPPEQRNIDDFSRLCAISTSDSGAKHRFWFA
ncbi:ferric iron ABC transporter ATP-binding protein [Vibrio astriarenae]|nr:ferric iron ABC transporter ATP-binding protein [Vibrio sp. C7]